MLAPCVDDFTASILHHSLYFRQLFCGKTVVFRKIHIWLQPELGFPILTIDVYMWTTFFTREKKESVLLPFENGRTHQQSVLCVRLSFNEPEERCPHPRL